MRNVPKRVKISHLVSFTQINQIYIKYLSSITTFEVEHLQLFNELSSLDAPDF